MKNFAESVPNPAEEPKKLDIKDEDIESLVESFREMDEEKAGPEKERAAEFREMLTKLVKSSAVEEAGRLMEDAQSYSGDEMITLVIDRALEVGGVKADAKSETLDAFMANSELRAQAKQELMSALEAKMTEAGNDLEMVSRLEKAIDALGA